MAWDSAVDLVAVVGSESGSDRVLLHRRIPRENTSQAITLTHGVLIPTGGRPYSIDLSKVYRADRLEQDSDRLLFLRVRG